jgi:hypothetical protein
MSCVTINHFSGGAVIEDDEASISDVEQEDSEESEGGNHEAIFGAMTKKRRRREYEAACQQQQQRNKKEDELPEDGNAPASSAGRSDVIPFDYEAEAVRRERRSELDNLHGRIDGGGDRGGREAVRGRTSRHDQRGGRRKGDGTGRGRASSTNAGSSSSATVGKELRGGKRSALTPANGNRTSTFK